MGHGAIAARRHRPVRLRRSDARTDPACTACGGSGRFVADWKSSSVPLPCPRCVRTRTAGPLREEHSKVRPDILQR